MNKRKHNRVQINDLQVDISDGIGFFSGDASDISRFGLGLINMAKKLGQDADKYTIVISGHGKSFKLKAHPKWETADGLTKKIGLEIDNVPWEWTQFVDKFDADSEEEDIWGVRKEK